MRRSLLLGCDTARNRVSKPGVVLSVHTVLALPVLSVVVDDGLILPLPDGP